MRTSFFIALTTTRLFSYRPVQASDIDSEICDLQPLDYANATVSNSNPVPALHPQDPINGSLYGEYTISTAVRELSTDKDSTSILQDFWMKSSKPISTPPLQLPFAGCAFFLLSGAGSSLFGADLDNVGCSKALPAGCEDALIDALRTNVTALSEEALSDNTNTCSSLKEVLQTPPTECRGAVWDVGAIQPFGNPNFQALGSTCNESAVNVFDGSATSNVLYYINYNISPNVSDTYYQMLLKTSFPIFLAAWPRNVTSPWIADVRSSCLTPAAGVKAGSEGATSGAVSSLSFVGLPSMAWTLMILLTLVFLS